MNTLESAGCYPTVPIFYGAFVIHRHLSTRQPLCPEVTWRNDFSLEETFSVLSRVVIKLFSAEAHTVDIVNRPNYVRARLIRSSCRRPSRKALPHSHFKLVKNPAEVASAILLPRFEVLYLLYFLICLTHSQLSLLIGGLHSVNSFHMCGLYRGNLQTEILYAYRTAALKVS